jgi:hypothetical protein
VCAPFPFLREAAHVAGVHFKKSMWCLRYETGEMTARDHYHCLLSVQGSEWVGIATCFYLMDFWEKKLRCGHARVRVFAPALGGADYTCKDLADSLAGKDRYKFEKFFAPSPDISSYMRLAAIGRIKVQHQFLGRLLEGGDELLYEHPMDGHRRGAVCLALQPAKGGAAGQRFAALHSRLPGQIVPQGVVVIEILVTQRQPVDALPQQIGHRVGDETRIAPVLENPGQRRGKPHSAIRLPQEHHPAITGDIAAGKTRLNFAAIKAWKTKVCLCTLWH